MSLEPLLDRLRAFREARGWAKFHRPKNLAISISVEAAELLELYQWRPDEQTCDPELIARARGEIADILIYLTLFSDALGIDPVEAAHAKIDENSNRFPVLTKQHES